MYIALKTHTSFESEVLLISDLKHDVTAESWAMLIKERMESESASADFIAKVMEALANAW